MPPVFFLDHPVGSVIGRADFGNYFSFSQNCTVGNNKGKYPNIGKNVKMMSGSKIIGNCKIGDNVIVSANTYLKDVDIPDCSLVFGSSPKINIVPKPASYFSAYE
jgi:serine O-acetyltransferase